MITKQMIMLLCLCLIVNFIVASETDPLAEYQAALCEYSQGHDKAASSHLQNYLNCVRIGSNDSPELVYAIALMNATQYYMHGQYEFAQRTMAVGDSCLDQNMRKNHIESIWFLDGLLLTYNNAIAMKDSQRSDSLWNIIKQYGDNTNITKNYVFSQNNYQVAKAYCQQDDYAGALEFLKTAPYDTTDAFHDESDQMFSKAANSLERAYIYHHTQSDSVSALIDRVIQTNFNIQDFEERQNIQIGARLLRVLFAYDHNDLVTCRKELQHVYAITQSDLLCRTDFEFYLSPLMLSDWDRLQEIEKTVFFGNSSAGDICRTGIKYIEQGEYEKGIENLNNSLEIYQADKNWQTAANAAYYLAMGYYLSGKYSTAARIIDKGEIYWKRCFVPSTSSTYHLGLLLLKSQVFAELGKKAESEKAFDLIVEYHPMSSADSTKFYKGFVLDEMVARAYNQQAEYQKAIEYLRSLPDYGHDNVKATIGLGVAYALYKSNRMDSLAIYVRDLRERINYNKLSCSLQLQWELLDLLIDYKKSDVESCKDDLKSLYYDDAHNQIKDMQYLRYNSPFLPEDWEELLRIEKELKK